MAKTTKISAFLFKIDKSDPVGLQIKAKRQELKLRQEDAAKQLGVTEDALRFWEKLQREPRIEHFPKIIEFLGYNPFQYETTTLGGRIKHYRIVKGLSQKKLGKILGVDGSTVYEWEENYRKPNPKNITRLDYLTNQKPLR